MATAPSLAAAPVLLWASTSLELYFKARGFPCFFSYLVLVCSFKMRLFPTHSIFFPLRWDAMDDDLFLPWRECLHVPELNFVPVNIWSHLSTSAHCSNLTHICACALRWPGLSSCSWLALCELSYLPFYPSNASFPSLHIPAFSTVNSPSMTNAIRKQPSCWFRRF